MEPTPLPDEPVEAPLVKRLLDIAVSALLLILFAPLVLLIVLAIKFEGLFAPKNRGPILYAETRMSQGLPFSLRKFRIFKTHAYESIRSRGEMVHTSKLQKNPENITHTGRMLKAFYWDEIPQLWNVFTGDMSLIGPRPWNPVDYKNEVARGEYRKKVIKAGLTGPVQIHKLDANKHGGERTLDGDYIKFVKTKSGLRVAVRDIKLLAQSLWFMLKGQGL